MISHPHYRVESKIYEGTYTLVYRGIRLEDQLPVILKVLKAEYPTLKEIARFRYEYELTRHLDLMGIVRPYALEAIHNQLMLVLEDFGGQSLHDLLGNAPLAIETFFEIALPLVDALRELHQAGVIHKDIKPRNIIVNLGTGQVKLTDFGLASRLPRETQPSIFLAGLEGSLAFISPEQTGRMNRSIDERSDFYSLGVTFYQMLTGKLPFETQDPMELVYSHIAKLPLPPDQVRPEVPASLSAITMKLLAKTAEERYQSAYGLKADLEACQRQQQRLEQILVLIPGQHDVTTTLHIPQKLYGREAEIRTIMLAFEQVSRGAAAFVLVSGVAGAGKTALVREVHKPLMRERGYFIEGKFDQLQRTIPYAPVVQALQSLIRQLLTEPEEEVTRWRQHLLTALGHYGRVVTEVIPELELIIGPQPALPSLGLTETQNRFQLVFLNFIQVLATRDHPLVIFLDDIQWADMASLKLLQFCLTNLTSSALLVIGAYRLQEVPADHPLHEVVSAVQQAGVPATKITLSQLALPHIAQLLSDTLHQPFSQVTPLADVVLSKTQGNPFFLTQFVFALYQEDLLTFDFRQGRWIWDVSLIQQAAVTENVLAFLTGKLQQLAAPTQNALQLAACIGSRFDLKTLALIHGRSQAETAADLWEPLQEGLIVALDGEFRLVAHYDQAALEHLTISYQFLHDRVQQAAYALLSESTRPKVHLRLGQLLLTTTSPEAQEERLFEIVDHLNRGRTLLTEQHTRLHLVNLNLLAGQKAKGSTAYEAARQYFTAGMELLPPNKWSAAYETTLALAVGCAEMEYVSTNYDRAESLFAEILAHARTILDTIKVYELQSALYTSVGKRREALETGVRALEMLGITLHESTNAETAHQEILAFTANHQPDRIRALLTLPPMTDPQQAATMRILVQATNPAYVLGEFQLLWVIATKLVQFSIMHGNTPASAFGYVVYGLLETSRGQLEVGYEFGRVALQLVETFEAQDIRTKVIYLFAHFISGWKHHARENLTYLLESYQSGLEAGDLAYLTYSIEYYILYSWLIGTELPEIEQQVARYSDILHKAKQEDALPFFYLIEQLILNLQNRAQDPHRLVGKRFDEQSTLSYWQQINHRTLLFTFHTLKLVLLYLQGEYSGALEHAQQARPSIQAVAGQLILPEYLYFTSLTMLSLYHQVSPETQQSFLAESQASQQQLQAWAHHCPDNFLHKAFLVSAELSRILGHDLEAMALYDQAIDSAQAFGYRQHEALASELAGRFYLAQGRTRIAKLYLREAQYGYQRWGASAKVQQLVECYPSLLNHPVASSQPLAPGEWLTTTMTTEHQGSGLLDLTTALNASYAIAEEIVLEQLLTTLMHRMLENAGAKRGILILSGAGELLIQAESGVVPEETQVLQAKPITHTTNLPTSIIHYVTRTREAVVLWDATQDKRFQRDPYIAGRQPKSVLCMPLIYQGQLIGLVYLENDLVRGVFTTERLLLLQVLSSQAAISIKNARLYDDLAALNQAAFRFVPQEFLRFLGKASIIEVQLGDQVQREMSVMFADVRDFTTLSEHMSPAENFNFINSLLNQIGPLIRKQQGFIDKYLGDGIMALFPETADHAVQAAIALLHQLEGYNATLRARGQMPIRVGIGMHTGTLMLGTIGEMQRMEGTVISDAVNLAARLEGLTKRYGTHVIISEQTRNQLADPHRYLIRFLGRVQVKGKIQSVSIFEVFDGDPAPIRDLKAHTRGTFERALEALYTEGDFDTAAQAFQEVLTHNPHDQAAAFYWHYVTQGQLPSAMLDG